MIVGVISDTHGLMRPEALDALAGVDLVLHAGDVGSPSVLSALGGVAPVQAVRGNVDHDQWARALPVTTVVTAEEALLYLLHDQERLDVDPEAAGFAAVVSGHTHTPLVHRRGDVLYVNPGSAGPTRGLPPTVARLTVTGSTVAAEIVTLGSRWPR